MRSPSMQAQAVSAIPQGGNYVQRAPLTRRREYPGGGSNNNGPRRPHRDQRPPIVEDILTEVGDPLTVEDTLMEDPW